MVLVKVPNRLEFGTVITQDDGRIRRLLEKPDRGEVFSDTVNAGTRYVRISIHQG